MIARVVPTVSPDPGGAAVASRLAGFHARLRRQFARGAATRAGAVTLLALGAPALGAAWLLAGSWPFVLAIVPLVVAAAMGVAALRTYRLAAAALLRVAAHGDVSVFGDEFATWLEWAPRRREAALLAWLGQDLAARLRRLPEQELQRLGRRRLGRWLWLLPLALLVALAWLLAAWLQPPWPGVLGGRTPPPPAAAGGAGSGPGIAAQQAPAPEPPRHRPDAPQDRAPPPPPPGDETPPGAAEPPAPLLDLPSHLQFAVPVHLGDGPTRRRRMHAAELPEPAGGGAAHAARAPGGDEQVLAVPPPIRETFARAAEAALRARSVPPQERAMVRRFFDLLQEAAR